jgi:hypothetical protein
MTTKTTEMSPQDVGLVLGTLLNAAAECEEAANRNHNHLPDFARTMTARARALVAVAERFEVTMLADLEPVGWA